MGKFRLRRLISLKLLPELAKLLSLILRKDIEDPVRGFYLPLSFGLVSYSVICIGIPCVYFHNIVDQYHSDHLYQIHLFIGIL